MNNELKGLAASIEKRLNELSDVLSECAKDCLAQGGESISLTDMAKIVLKLREVVNEIQDESTHLHEKILVQHTNGMKV